MFELLIRITKYYAVKFLQLPGNLWIEMQWTNQRYRESCHLLRLDNYLLKDMGLRKVNGRIEAIDPSRLDPERKPATPKPKSGFGNGRARHVN